MSIILAVSRLQKNVWSAGLGGGMGIFLAEPITKALNEALTARAALSEVRRVLEIIVPLAYRPPIKVSMTTSLPSCLLCVSEASLDSCAVHSGGLWCCQWRLAPLYLAFTYTWKHRLLTHCCVDSTRHIVFRVLLTLLCCVVSVKSLP